LEPFLQSGRLWIDDETIEGYAGCDLPDIITAYYAETRKLIPGLPP
jgi:hypothetical protein